MPFWLLMVCPTDGLTGQRYERREAEKGGREGRDSSYTVPAVVLGV